VAEFVITRLGSFASEFGFLSVVPALIQQVPQMRTLILTAPRPCDFILASNAPRVMHTRAQSFALPPRRSTFLKRKES
jgi:hypothetical protein